MALRQSLHRQRCAAWRRVDDFQARVSRRQPIHRQGLDAAPAREAQAVPTILQRPARTPSSYQYPPRGHCPSAAAPERRPGVARAATCAGASARREIGPADDTATSLGFSQAESPSGSALASGWLWTSNVRVHAARLSLGAEFGRPCAEESSPFGPRSPAWPFGRAAEYVLVRSTCATDRLRTSRADPRWRGDARHRLEPTHRKTDRRNRSRAESSRRSRHPPIPLVRATAPPGENERHHDHEEPVWV